MTVKKAKTQALDYTNFVLPASIVTRIDISRMLTEAEWADNEFTAVKVRKKVGVTKQAPPTLSSQLSGFLEANDIAFDDAKLRTALIKQLRLLKDRVPTVHLTFAVPADGKSLEKLADWVRANLNPQAVIEVGLQPALVGGVSVRTPNRMHDFSMRSKLIAGRGVIAQELEALRGRK